MSKRPILFIAPHADDIEVLCNSTCQAAVAASYPVHECLACADEYGTDKIKFRGRRIARIRKHEMYEVAKLYGTNSDGTPKIKLHWMPYIDGFVPFNKEAVARYKKLIEEIDPWLIIGPDPFLPIDTHPDHINTGYNFYYALKAIHKNKRPKLALFYQTTSPNIFLPFGNQDLIYKTRIRHRSQLPPLLMKIFTVFGQIFKRSIANGGRMADSFRIVEFSPKAHRLSEEKWTFRKRLKQGIWYYGIQFGNNGNQFYQDPGYDAIMADYNANGHP